MRAATAFAILLSGCCVWAQSSLDEAWSLVRSGHRPAAMQLLAKILKTNPRDGNARLLYGSLLMEAGDKQQSIPQLEEAADLLPQSAEARNALGEAYNKFGERQLAAEAFQKAVSLDPQFATAQTNLGLMLLQDGKLDDSARHLDQAISLLGRTLEAAYSRYLRAKIYTAQSRPTDAAKELQTAVTLQPNFPEAWSDLGEAQRQNLNDTAALAAFERAVNLNPNDAIAQYRVGSEYLHQGKANQAADHLEQANRLHPKDQSTLNALQAALRQTGKIGEANEIRKQLADLLREKDQANQNALVAVRINNEGAALEKSGHLREAVAKYREAVRLDPQHVGMRVNYAVALLKSGEWTEGLNQLHTALLRDPQNETIRAALRDALAQAPPNLIPDWHDEWSRPTHPESK